MLQQLELLSLKAQARFRSEGEVRWTRQGSLVLLRESRGGQDISEVSGRILSKEISLTTRNASDR